jgi:hypothetical protein
VIVEFVDVRFQIPRAATSEVRDFYLHRLAFAAGETIDDDLLVVQVGSAVARFNGAPTSEAPFYHFALLVPGDRFEAAYSWLKARARLLPHPNTGDTIFDFDSWDALACYCLDPADNIIELIAHRGISETSTEGPFSAGEVVDFSEVGLVVPNKKQSVAVLEEVLGLRVWDGKVADPDRLVFVGERARTLILSPPRRGWLPTGRPAEDHPVELTLRGERRASVTLPGTHHRVHSV